MTIEEQIAGARYAGRVKGWAYTAAGDLDATVSVELEDRTVLRVPMLVTEAAKIQRGDTMTLTVEITREP